MWLNNIISSPSKTFLTFCCFFIASSSFTSLFAVPAVLAVYLYGLFFVIIAAIIFFWNNRVYRFFILSFLLVVLGVWRYVVTLPDCTAQNEICSYANRRVTFVGYVSGEPAQKVDSVTYKITAQKIVISNEREKSLSQLDNGQRSLGVNPLEMTSKVVGAVSMKNRLYPSFAYGDTLEITCNLEKPISNDQGTFHYDKYLSRYGMSAICLNPIIKKIGSGSGNKALQYIFTFKNYLNNKLASLWPEPEGSLMAGILYGSKNGLPPYLTNSFSRTGVSHIIAVSGFNITIIAVVLMSLLIYFGLYRQQAFYAVIAVIVLFTIFSGLSASAVRAAVMGIVVLVGKQMGRNARIGNVLVLTVAVMQLGNPYLVLWDVGFQLSFLATLGLVYVSPFLEKFAARFTPSWLERIAEPLVTTLAAIITTFPLILYQFGTFSIIAPLVNILLLWIIPWIMLAGFLSVIGAVIFTPLGQIIAAVTHFGLAYVILVVQYFGKKSWASANIPIPFWLMTVMYSLLIIIIAKNKTKKF